MVRLTNDIYLSGTDLYIQDMFTSGTFGLGKVKNGSCMCGRHVGMILYLLDKHLHI